MPSRRAAVATALAGLALGAMTGAADARPARARRGSAAAALPEAWRRPPRLVPGATVGLVEPAGLTADPVTFELAEASLAAMGLKVRTASNRLARFGYLAGTDAERAGALNALWRDPEVSAIFALRGGWGSARILPLLDWEAIRARPKLLVGFSDITALHLALAARTRTISIHGPNAADGWSRFSWDAFRALAFDAATPTLANPPSAEDRLVPARGRTRAIRPGVARGRLLGGNLTVLSHLVGTPWLPDFTGAILFLEDVEEGEYRIDRMLTHLALAGVLGRVAGVVFGTCSRCTGGMSHGNFTLTEVLDQQLGSLSVPVLSGLQFGHIAEQFSLPVGAMAELDAGAGTLTILEPAVA